MQERSPPNRVGRKKENRNRDGICAPGRVLWKRKGSLTLGSRFTSREDQRGEKGSFRSLEESAAACVQQEEHRETCTEGPVHLTAIPSLGPTSAGTHRGWVPKLGLQRTDLRRRLGLAAWRQPKGAGVWSTAANGGHAQEGTQICHWRPIVNLQARREGRGLEQQPHSQCAHRGWGSASMFWERASLGEPPTHGGRAETPAYGQWPHSFRSRVEIWVFQQLWYLRICAPETAL